MKHLSLIFILCITLVGCQKNKTQPAPTPSPPVTQATPPLTAQEQQLVGTWIMDSTAIYNGNTRISGTVSSNTLTCRIEFYSSCWNGGTEWRDTNAGHINCTLNPTNWKAPTTNYVNIGGVQYGIMLITTTNLILTGSNTRYYFHK